MPFHIRPIREFLLRPSTPAALARLPELAFNILWSWEPLLRALFRRLDPALWRESGYNPVDLLGRIPQVGLERAATDPRYLALYAQACERFDSHMRRPAPATGDKLVCYFSAEYGLTECLPIYSGGLGILSGDHLKSASDCDIPLVGVGLLYQCGYFRQHLNADGWQQERYPINDFYALPVSPERSATGEELKVAVDLPTGKLWIQVWRLDVGRTRLFLLDTNIADNRMPQDRDITDQLYGGDLDTRMRQEIVLGIGGLRALKALGLEPTVYHMNEGHSAFLGLERIRVFMKEKGLSFDEALEACRPNNVFTTHTPVPAGIDLFDAGMMHYYFDGYCRETGIGFEQLMGLGRKNPQDPEERFSMAILALKISAYRNAVSRLHRSVSQEMWSELWPELPAWEVPITSVTNGVHLPSWLNSDLANLYDQYLPPDWRERAWDPLVWNLIREIPDEELMQVHRGRKTRLITFVRQEMQAAEVRRKASPISVRRAEEILDPAALTIGFARRFATYKRATLIFRDVERLKKILCNPDRPVQIVIAGKAHPKDQPGKTLIREIVQLSRDPDLHGHLVFVEDYDIKVARELVQGVDIWLNNPRRGEEACGTSGMKAGLNGVLNLSILDGWFDEAYEISGGWAIGEREQYWNEQDEIHSSAIYSLLENEIIPLYYDRRNSAEWVKRVKESLTNLSPRFDCRRMVSEYDSQLYEPAHLAWTELSAGGFEKARDRVRWSKRVIEVWDKVQFMDVTPAPVHPVSNGTALNIRATLNLAGLRPNDVRVEIVLGQVGASGYLEHTEVQVLPPCEENGTSVVFAREILPGRTGRIGYAVRVSPNHCDDPLTRPCPDLLRWGT